jgi:molecular chaperone HtpG
MPYRSKKQRRRVEAEQLGMVADMVRQFADPYAFLRELVQNGIDAGASHLEVRIELADDGQQALSVADDGEGMTREIIEGPLLTLFNSAKDQDPTKIGKYGVGFVSVLAVEPDEVCVETWRDDVAWLLRLLPDHSYELAEATPRPDSGTTVTLLSQASAQQFDEHISRGRAALVRWCRHAQLPVHLVVRRPGAVALRERVDRELAVPAAVCLRQRFVSDDGFEETFVVAPSGGRTVGDDGDAETSESFAGFYNHGLTLFETTDPPHPRLRGIRFKVDSPRLQHTVSRDNVRHDEGYAHVLAKVRELAEDPLEAEVERALRQAAGGAVSGEAVGHHLELLRAAVEPPLRLPASRVAVPSCDALFGDERVTSVADLVVSRALHHSPEPSAITAALAREHVPVLLASDPAMLPLVRQLVSARLVDVTEHYVYARELGRAELARSDRRLLREARLALEAGGAKLAHLALAACHSDPGWRAALCVEDESAEHLMTLEQGARWRRRFGGGLRLVLVDQHAAVIAARAAAERDASMAGQLLARYVLVEQHGELSARQSDGMLQHGTRRVRARRAR